MPNYLRSISEKRWYTHPDVIWLEQDELQADALADLNTTDGNLSVFQVSENITAERITIALAATRRSVGTAGYVLFEESVLDPLKLELKKTPGKTPDEAVNGVHYNVTHIPAHKLLELAVAILPCQQNTLLKDEVRQKLALGIKEKRLDPTMNFPKRLLQELQKAGLISQ